jgi:hypothetical protein
VLVNSSVDVRASVSDSVEVSFPEYAPTSGGAFRVHVSQ